MEHHKNISLENIQEVINGILYIEEWKPILGYEGLYEISSFGRVKRLHRRLKISGENKPDRIIVSSAAGDKKYLRVSLRNNGESKTISIHRLVGLHFLDLVKDKPHINHKTGRKLDNHFSQLEWCTPQENNEHGVMMGLLKRGVNKKPYIRKGYASRLKKVINIETKEVFSSMHEVAKINGYSAKYLGKQLRGDRLNTTPFRYLGQNENFVRRQPYKDRRMVKPIAVFDCEWNEKKRFVYFQDAAEFAKCSLSDISEFLRGKRSMVKGCKFKKIGEDGNYIEPVPFIPFIRPPKKIIIKQPATPPRPMVKHDADGKEIARFDSIGLAAKSIGIEKKQFKNSVNKSPRGYYKGFIWKYA